MDVESLKQIEYIYVEEELLGNDDQHQELGLDFNLLAKRSKLHRKKLSRQFVEFLPESSEKAKEGSENLSYDTPVWNNNASEASSK